MQPEQKLEFQIGDFVDTDTKLAKKIIIHASSSMEDRKLDRQNVDPKDDFENKKEDEMMVEDEKKVHTLDKFGQIDMGVQTSIIKDQPEVSEANNDTVLNVDNQDLVNKETIEKLR